MSGARASLIWSALAVALAVPIGVAATSPLLAWRDPVYIGAGLAGVIALALLLVQPLLAGGYLPGLTVRRARQAHHALGIALVGAVAIHVAALWVTSPPDVIDALLLASPTPFSAWGVIAMWAVFAAALVAALRGRVRPRAWRIAHTALAGSVVVCSVVHAMLIEGTMGMISKTALCALALAATVKVATRRRVR
jgi:predicted ferric reductase